MASKLTKIAGDTEQYVGQRRVQDPLQALEGANDTAALRSGWEVIDNKFIA